MGFEEMFKPKGERGDVGVRFLFLEFCEELGEELAYYFWIFYLIKRLINQLLLIVAQNPIKLIHIL